MTVTIRRAGIFDTRQMAILLNTIIARGGTTALTDPVTATILTDWMQTQSDISAWHVAEDENACLLGFQWIAPHSGLPDDCCDIATFVRVGETGIGIGSALFRATENAARALRYAAIVAVIRSDNHGGLAYYQSRGFESWRMWNDAPTAPRVMKRYALG